MLLAEALETSESPSEEVLAEIFGLLLVAASSGEAVAQRKIGNCYLQGRGCNEDPAAAANWFFAAAQQGDPEAEYELSVCYSEGRGVDPNPEEAENWLARATEHGFVTPSVTNS